MLYDDLDTIAGNSFSNFHAKGLDYLCLHRSEELTIKAYFYAGDAGPEVVCPHDHRYPFSTHILAGESGHSRYMIQPEFVGAPPNYQCFEWRTPLLGGSGFSWSGEVRLDRHAHEEYQAGDSYWCRADEIHTITIRRPDTVLLLYQHGDVVDRGTPTLTFVRGADKEPPRLEGLYDRMSLSQAEERFVQVRALIGDAP